jgi:hypothetical protein
MIWFLLNLGGASMLLALYLWVLSRIGHGGKGWPRLRRKRTRNWRSCARHDLPTREADELHRVH